MEIELEENPGLCDRCLGPVSQQDFRAIINNETGKIEKTVFYCRNCGRVVDHGVAFNLARFAFSLGQTVIDNGIASLLTRWFREPKHRPIEAFPMRLSEGITTEVNLLAAIERIDFTSIPGCVPIDKVYEEGLYLLKNFLKEKTEFLKKETGINFPPEWVNAILMATYAKKTVSRNRYPKFNYSVIQKLGTKYLGEKFILFPDDIKKDSYPLSPVLFNSIEDIRNAIGDGKAQVFKSYGFFAGGKRLDNFSVLGDIKIEFRELGGTGDGREYFVPEITIERFPAAVLFQDEHKAWIFY